MAAGIYAGDYYRADGAAVTALAGSDAVTVTSGGSHAQFGSYGHQEGDGAASVSGEEQIAFAADSLLEFINH